MTVTIAFFSSPPYRSLSEKKKKQNKTKQKNKTRKTKREKESSCWPFFDSSGYKFSLGS